MSGSRAPRVWSAGSPGCRTRRRPRSQAGFNLLLVITFVTVLNIGVAAALPRWSTVMQRHKEQELIFRGLQYAEAIRVFQARFGRYPVSLDELIEVSPRSIRRLWKDPMNPDGKWGLVFAEASTGGENADDDEDEEDEGRGGRPRRPRPSQRGRGNRGTGPADGERTGPVLGVRSLVKEEAMVRFAGGNKYSDWRFTPDLIEMPSGVMGMENVPRLYSRWFGRPLPKGIEVPAAGATDSGLDPPEEPTRDRRNRRNQRDRDSRGKRGDRGGG